MWVKIKNDKIPNVILTVPYSAYKNSYQMKGFIIINENGKELDVSNNKTVDSKNIDKDKQDNSILKDEKEQILDKKILELANKKSNSEIIDEILEDVNKKDNTVSIAVNRTPIKKASSKR